MRSRQSALTDNEGALLGLVLRVQPVTAYEIAKIYENSPVSNFSTSTGKLYPMIRRLRSLGLLEASEVKGDARGTVRVTCTPAGRDALKGWILQRKQDRALLEDPLRTMVQSFDLLSRDEQIEWALEMKLLLTEKMEELNDYQDRTNIPYKDLVLDNAFSSLRARMEWLDRLLLKSARHPRE